MTRISLPDLDAARPMPIASSAVDSTRPLPGRRHQPRRIDPALDDPDRREGAFCDPDICFPVIGPPPRMNEPFFAPLSFETDCLDLPVDGQLPAELVGTLYRNGPNPQYPDAGSRWFLGDGMIHAFRLGRGRASCRNRWVRTARFERERAAGRSLKGTIHIGHEDGAANAQVVSHGGRLWALEEAHAPIAVDARSLVTLGAADLGDGYRAPFTTHPKRDPQTGELLFIGYGLAGPRQADLVFGRLDVAGGLRALRAFSTPFPSLIHDFAITEHYALFPVLPLIASPQPLRDGGPAFAWSPSLGSRLGVMRRDTLTPSIRWFEGDPCFAFHVMNAFERSGADGRRQLTLDVMRYDEPPRMPRHGGQPADVSRRQARLSRWTLDPNGADGRFHQTPLDDRTGEYPRIDERQTGLPYRHGWIASAGLGRDLGVGAGRGVGAGLGPGGSDDRCDGIVHYDLQTGRQAEYRLPAGDRVSEPVFAARPGSVVEGDGWLLVVAYRADEDRSDLLVLEACAVERGPVATIHLPHRVPAGFHGCWVAGR